jgi:hypothetical protein
MKEVRNIYFKLTYGSNMRLISGLPLPNPAEGPYHFINCSFHPGLREEILKHYRDSKFTDCEF